MPPFLTSASVESSIAKLRHVEPPTWVEKSPCDRVTAATVASDGRQYCQPMVSLHGEGLLGPRVTVHRDHHRVEWAEHGIRQCLVRLPDWRGTMCQLFQSH